MAYSFRGLIWVIRLLMQADVVSFRLGRFPGARKNEGRHDFAKTGRDGDLGPLAPIRDFMHRFTNHGTVSW